MALHVHYRLKEEFVIPIFTVWSDTDHLAFLLCQMKFAPLWTLMVTSIAIVLDVGGGVYAVEIFCHVVPLAPHFILLALSTGFYAGLQDQALYLDVATE